ncbi:hypothetical protein TSPI_07257 [Trichinella spiralis]|uniref:Uncharacterized protein n=1 Tax=Trichinella spiralis TaxID=6334 RepID=A0ABR3KME8_TRISP
MNVRRLASYRLLLSNIESSLQWNKRRQSFFNFDTAWCVACGRPSITALTWCRGISWSVLREKSGKKQACSHIFFVEKLFSAFVIISVSTESCALIGAGCVKPAVFARLKPECVD